MLWQGVPVRRLTQHALAAAGISALAAGAVAGSLTSVSAQSQSMAVVAPVSVSSPASAPATPSDDTEQRLLRGTRGSQRTALSAHVAATARDKALQAQKKAVAQQEAALEKKRLAEAKKRAEEKKQRAQEKKERAEKLRRAAEKKQRAAEKRERAEKAAEAERLGYDASTSDPKSIARQIMSNKYGWGGSEFSCYNKIIMRESGWDVHADNPTSSAYGIPQALPGSKMASAGSDWRNNPATQIKWGLGYVKSRYGTPCSAWGFKSSHGWY